MPLFYILVRTGQGGVGAWWELVTTERTARLAATSLALALVVTAGSLVLGVGSAYLVTRTNVPFRRGFAVLAALPLAVPSYVAAYTWVSVADLWSSAARFEGFGAAVVVLTLYTYPYVYLPVAAAFAGADVAQEEVARSLGRGPWRTLTTVSLPQVRPAIAGGGLLAILYILSDFGAVLGVLAALAVLAGVLFLSPALAVRDITVRGAELTDPARVESALDAYRGVPLTRISKDEVRERVGRIPQVRSIEVLLEPPHHLVVALRERVPVAAIEDDGEFVVVDSEGVELMTAGSAEEAGVPVVTGGRDVLEGERFEAIADVLAALPESVLAQLRTASAESLSSVELAFTDGRTVVWGTAEDSELKSQVLRELVEARGAGSGVETYDVSSPTRPVVR